jgi:NAD(P)-dependent dehydrogenase (short-subunit alcohol dehydrogenase family)
MRTGMGDDLVMPQDIDPQLMRYVGIRPAAPPEAVAELILFVASDRGRGVHGAVLHADGGVSAG